MIVRLRGLRAHILAMLLNLSLCGLLVLQLRDPRETATRVEVPPTRTPAPSATPVRLQVFVSGAVLRPGVVQLAEGARAVDAVTAAGGMSDEAAHQAINLAAPLSDGMQLHVPALSEADGLPGAWLGPGSAPASAPPAGGGYAAGVAPAGGQVDLNRASAVDLEQLPGIGPALASRIVAHREANGAFGAVDDLLEVSGIGEKTLARFRDRVTAR